MPHPRDWQDGQMPRSCPGGGGAGRSWNWLMHYFQMKLKGACWPLIWSQDQVKCLKFDIKCHLQREDGNLLQATISRVLGKTTITISRVWRADVSIEEEVGSGTFGSVYIVKYKKEDRNVVVKKWKASRWKQNAAFKKELVSLAQWRVTEAWLVLIQRVLEIWLSIIAIPPF